MATGYANKVSFTTPTTGTGTVNIIAALGGWQLPPPGLASGSTVGYTIIDGASWEVGTGVYTTGSPPTLSRVVVEDSSSGAGVLQNLSGYATVSVSFVITAAQYNAGYASAASPAFTGTPTAPTAAAGTNSMQIATTAFVEPAYSDIGRNKLHNSLFNIQQRGTGAWTTTLSYTADRWILQLTGDTDSVTVATLADADRAAIGDEEATYCLQNVFTGVNLAANFSLVAQYIEGVRRLANRSVVVSFWAKATSGTPKFGVSIDQYFGTGGSPSATVTGVGISTTISTTWTRYSLAITTAALTAKTIGTNNNDYSQLNLWYSGGVNLNGRDGTIGVQTNTVSLWGVQVEIGTIVTPLEKPDAALDLANCQRFYQIGNFSRGGYIASTVVDTAPLLFPVQMRAAPAVTPTFTTQTNCASSTTAGITVNGFSPSTTGSSTAVFSLIGSFTASADL